MSHVYTQMERERKTTTNKNMREHRNGGKAIRGKYRNLACIWCIWCIRGSQGISGMDPRRASSHCKDMRRHGTDGSERGFWWFMRWEPGTSLRNCLAGPTQHWSSSWSSAQAQTVLVFQDDPIPSETGFVKQLWTWIPCRCTKYWFGLSSALNILNRRHLLVWPSGGLGLQPRLCCELRLDECWELQRTAWNSPPTGIEVANWSRASNFPTALYHVVSAALFDLWYDPLGKGSTWFNMYKYIILYNYLTACCNRWSLHLRTHNEIWSLCMCFQRQWQLVRVKPFQDCWVNRAVCFS